MTQWAVESVPFSPAEDSTKNTVTYSSKTAIIIIKKKKACQEYYFELTDSYMKKQGWNNSKLAEMEK